MPRKTFSVPLNMISNGKGCDSKRNLVETTEAIRETRCRVLAWFSFKGTSGAPSKASTDIFLEPASFMKILFWSQPYIVKLIPNANQAKALMRTFVSHIARNRSRNTTRKHLYFVFGLRRLTRKSLFHLNSQRVSKGDR